MICLSRFWVKAGEGKFQSLEVREQASSHLKIQLTVDDSEKSNHTKRQLQSLKWCLKTIRISKIMRHITTYFLISRPIEKWIDFIRRDSFFAPIQ